MITVGFPSARGNLSLGLEGALEPMVGAGAVSTSAGDFQDASSCWKVISITIESGGGVATNFVLGIFKVFDNATFWQVGSCLEMIWSCCFS